MKYAFEGKDSALKAALWEIGYIGCGANGFYIPDADSVYPGIGRFLTKGKEKIEIWNDKYRKGFSFARLSNGEGDNNAFPNLFKSCEFEVEVYAVPNPWKSLRKKARTTKICLENGDEGTYRAWVVHPLDNNATVVLDKETARSEIKKHTKDIFPCQEDLELQ